MVLTSRTDEQMAVSSSLLYGNCANSIALLENFLVRRIFADGAGDPRILGGLSDAVKDETGGKG